MRAKITLRGIAVALMGVVLTVGGVLSQAPEAQALTIGECSGSLEGLGLCTKEVTLSGNTLTISLTNTSTAANGGFITADAFDLAGAATITNFVSTSANFSLTSLNTTDNNISVSPFGTREFLISTGGAFLGAGSPNGGIGVGSTETFTLTLGGTFSGVTEANVFSTEAVRFRGFNDGGSDKTLTTTVPEPASLLLLGAGLAAIGIWRRKVLKG